MLIANLKYGVFLIISCIVALSRTSILKIWAISAMNHNMDAFLYFFTFIIFT